MIPKTFHLEHGTNVEVEGVTMPGSVGLTDIQHDEEYDYASSKPLILQIHPLRAITSI